MSTHSELRYRNTERDLLTRFTQAFQGAPHERISLQTFPISIDSLPVSQGFAANVTQELVGWARDSTHTAQRGGLASGHIAVTSQCELGLLEPKQRDEEG